MNHVEAAATYVNITREEFEAWLSTQGKRWNLKQGYSGIYRLHLSDSVAIEINSTLGREDENVGRAGASMKMKLVSTLTGRTLNKKAQGQKYFTRTQNWRKNLAQGVDRMKNAYRRAAPFYEAIAEIADRERYKQEILSDIESIPGWEDNRMLSEFHAKVSSGGILTRSQRDSIEQAATARLENVSQGRGRDPKDMPAGRPRPEPVTPTLTSDQEAFLERLRRLYQAAKADGDDWTMNFARDIGERLKGGRYKLSPKQREILVKKINRYRV